MLNSEIHRDDYDAYQEMLERARREYVPGSHQLAVIDGFIKKLMPDEVGYPCGILHYDRQRLDDFFNSKG